MIVTILTSFCVFATVVNFYSTEFRGTASLFCGVVSRRNVHTNAHIPVHDKHSTMNKSVATSNTTQVCDIDKGCPIRKYVTRNYKVPDVPIPEAFTQTTHTTPDKE